MQKQDNKELESKNDNIDFPILSFLSFILNIFLFFYTLELKERNLSIFENIKGLVEINLLQEEKILLQEELIEKYQRLLQHRIVYEKTNQFNNLSSINL